jgi:hypothetical protein
MPDGSVSCTDTAVTIVTSIYTYIFLLKLHFLHLTYVKHHLLIYCSSLDALICTILLKYSGTINSLCDNMDGWIILLVLGLHNCNTDNNVHYYQLFSASTSFFPSHTVHNGLSRLTTSFNRVLRIFSFHFHLSHFPSLMMSGLMVPFHQTNPSVVSGTEHIPICVKLLIFSLLQHPDCVQDMPLNYCLACKGEWKHVALEIMFCFESSLINAIREVPAVHTELGSNWVILSRTEGSNSIH